MRDILQKDKYKKLGLNIAYYRKLRGYTQAELARLLQIDRTHMGNMELAATGTSLDLLFRLSDALEIPVYKLFLFRD